MARSKQSLGQAAWAANEKVVRCVFTIKYIHSLQVLSKSMRRVLNDKLRARSM